MAAAPYLIARWMSRYLKTEINLYRNLGLSNAYRFIGGYSNKKTLSIEGFFVFPKTFVRRVGISRLTAAVFI
jgi:hypothetical protein